MKEYYDWNVSFVLSSQRDFGLIPNVSPNKKEIGRMFSTIFCDTNDLFLIEVLLSLGYTQPFWYYAMVQFRTLNLK